MHNKISLIIFGLLLYSCGPEENNTTNNASNNATNNSTSSNQNAWKKLNTISFSEGETLTASALNKDGTKIAVATRSALDFVYRVRIYSTDSGDEILELKGFIKPLETMKALISVEDLFWADNDHITAMVTYRSHYTWDANTGDLLTSHTEIDATNPCAGSNKKQTFNPAKNELFVVASGIPRGNSICRIDFNTGTQTKTELTEGKAVESIVLDSLGENLWVNFSNPTEMNGLSKAITESHSYKESDLLVRSEKRDTKEEIVAVSNAFFVVESGQSSLVIPGGKVFGVNRTRSFSAKNEVMMIEDKGKTLVIALPSGLLIGSLPKDNFFVRSMSSDGKRVASVDDGKIAIDIYDVSARTTRSSFVP